MELFDDIDLYNNDKQSQKDNVYTVTQITNSIKNILEPSFRNIKVEGEISNWRPSAAGHIYFTLKDNTSQIKAVMFKSASYGLKIKPKDGDKVCCSGSLSLYAPQGSYQIVVQKMEPIGSGNILQMLEERKRKLAQEGLFNEERKKPLPRFPRTIGVVTSPTGAAIRDILNVCKRRNPTINIIVLPAIVQGEGASDTIVNMINKANYYNMCDVLIVGRGGGSLEDLLPFSEENVIRAIAASHIPTISAVGHEIDWALCDYAADFRAPTPSAAAEMASTPLNDIVYTIETMKNDLYETMKSRIEQKKLLVKSFNPESLEIRFRNIQQPLLNRYDSAKEALVNNLELKMRDLRNKIQNCKTVLENASPETIFQRGYSMVTDKDGNIIRDASTLSVDDLIEITPAKGKINAKITNIK